MTILAGAAAIGPGIGSGIGWILTGVACETELDRSHQVMTADAAMTTTRKKISQTIQAFGTRT